MKLYMPSGRASKDRKFFGCWLYQTGDIVFIGEKNPCKWISAFSIESNGMEWWERRIERRHNPALGWPLETVIADFRLAAAYALEHAKPRKKR